MPGYRRGHARGDDAAQRHVLRGAGIDALPVRREPALRRQHLLRRRSRRPAPTRSCSTSAPASASGARPSRTTAPSSPTRSSRTSTSTTCRACRSSPPPTGPVPASTSTRPPQERRVARPTAFDGFIRPPYFPIRWGDLRGDYRFHEVSDTDARRRRRQGDGARRCPTSAAPTATGSSSAARRSPTSATTRCRMDGSSTCPARVLELADGVDLLIHDAQYTPEEFAEKAALGPLHRRLRRRTSRSGRGAGGWRCSTTTRTTTTTIVDAHARPGPAPLPAGERPRGHGGGRGAHGHPRRPAAGPATPAAE